MAAESKVKHFTDLDGLRGVLAFGIVLLHYGINALVQRATHGELPGFLLQLSVDFFFILSGFVLTHSAQKGLDPVTFAKRRAWRLLPVYFVTLFVVVALGFVTTAQVPYLTIRPSLLQIGADVLLAYPLVSQEPLNIPAWSITWELYLPILALAVTRITPVVAMSKALLAISLTISGLLAWRVALGEHWYAARAVAGLLAGAMLYRSGLSCNGKALFPLLGGAAAIIAFGIRLPMLGLAFPLVASALVLAGTNTRTFLSRVPAAFLGRISYTLYMVHVPILIAAALLTPDLSAHPATKALALLAAIGVAALLTETVERWGIRRGHRRP